MDIIETPETYVPKMDSNTKLYSDQNMIQITHGLICPCTPGKVFQKRDTFKNHMKSNRHKKWIEHLNENAVNYYAENMELKETIKTQKMLLTQYETKVKQKETIIDYLEKKTKTKTKMKVEEQIDYDIDDLLNFCQ